MKLLDNRFVFCHSQNAEGNRHRCYDRQANDTPMVNMSSHDRFWKTPMIPMIPMIPNDHISL